MASSRNRLVPSFAVAALVAAAALAGSVTAARAADHPGSADAPRAVDTANCASFSADLEQLVRPGDDANLLTKWSSEANNAKDLFGFSDDRGVVAKVALRAGTGLVPVWRLYRGGDFVWAVDGADSAAFVADGYQRQFVDFYASSTPQACLGGIHRLERGDLHRTAKQEELAALVKDGWVDRGAAFYVATTQRPAPAPPLPSTADTKFSIALIPDTQNETSSLSGTRFSNRVGWLVANKTQLDLRYAIQIGDLTSWGNVAPAQFDKASAEIRPLEAVIPWSVAAGNHDTAAVCAGGSACPGVDATVAVRDVSTFNRTFPPSRFGALRGTYEPNKSENSYATFSAGGKSWLVLTLELWARPAVVAWANNVVRANPESNVIVNTHSYMSADGSISTSNGGYGATSPQYLFDNLISQHPNIVMVVSGHTGQGAVRTDVGRAGNTVVSLLQAFHSVTNPVRLVEIDTAAGTVTSRVYAPETDTDYPQYSTKTTGMDFR